MPVTRAMVMAAGLGTRLKPFTDLEPKALMPVMGVPVAQFAFDSLLDAGVSTIVANVHHHADSARARLEGLDHAGGRLVISDESELLLGSAGGIRKASSHFGNEPFFMINADQLCDADLRALARTHEKLRSQWNVAVTLAVFPQAPSSGKYREIYLDFESGLVKGFSPDLREGRPFYIGNAVLEVEALKDVPMSGPAGFIPTILEPRIRERRVGFYLASGNWKDIGSPSLWLDAHLFLIRALETGRISTAWRKRLEKVNHRLESEIWASRESLSLRLREHASGWSGPCYYSGAQAPRELGPEAVLYGAPSPGQVPQRGIGFGGHWTKS